MAKELTDDELNLRRKARRRLVGAIALTLAVVVILPMVLDSEPKPAGQDIDLRIPDPEKIGEFEPGVAIPEQSTLPPAPAPEVESSQGVTDIPAVEAPAAGPETAAAAPGKEAVAENNTKAVSAKAQNDTAIKPKAEETAKPKVAEATKAKVVEKAKPKVAEAPKPKVAEKPAAAATESFVAQIGAYSNADTAKQELAKLKKWGFKAYMEKSGDKTRVRVGPYSTREKAEKVVPLLEKHGLKPVVLGDK